MKHTLRVWICLLMILCLSLAACNGGSWRDDLTSASLSDTVKASLPAGDGWTVVSDDYISSSEWGEDYTVLLDALADRQILISEQSDMNVDEIGVFHIQDSGDVKKAKAIVDAYVSAKKLRMAPLLESYNQAELPKLDCAEVTVCGNYILYTILNAEDTAAAHEVFEKVLKTE